MKKIGIVLVMFFLLIGVNGLGQPAVMGMASLDSDANTQLYDRPMVEVSLRSIFDQENEINHPEVVGSYGSTLRFDGAITEQSGYNFAYWVVNGVVRHDLAFDHEFVLLRNMHIDAIFTPEDKHAVVFIDTNVQLLDVQYVSPGENALEPDIDLPSKPGYIVDTIERWSDSLEHINENRVLILQYEIYHMHEFSVTVENGYVFDVEHPNLSVSLNQSNTYYYNSMVTVRSEDPDFKYWVSDTRIVSYDRNYSFHLLEDKAIQAVSFEGAVEVEPLITLSNRLNLRTAYDSYMAQMYIPETYTLIEHGMLRTEHVMSFEDVTIDNALVDTYQGTVRFGRTNEFLMSFKNAREHVRAYMILEYQGDLYVYYSESKDFDQLKPNHRNYYQLFVRSFADSSGDGIGDFNGITENLDYFVEMGIDALWLLPIHPSNSMHGYDVLDFYDVNSDYGTMEDFVNLVDAAAEQGIDIVLDFVLNHTSDQHPWFLEFLAGNLDYEDFYRRIDASDPRFGTQGSWGQDIWHPIGDGTYYAGYFNGMLPDLNWTEEVVQDEILNISKYWMAKGVAGFRLDAALHLEAANEIDPSLNAYEENMQRLLEFEDALKAVYPDAYIVGEIWDSFDTYSDFFAVMDSAFHFEYSDLIISMLQQESGLNYANQLASWEYLSQAVDSTAISAPFLRNHDQDRFASIIVDDEKQRLGAELLLTAPGNPFIYYGEELGMKGVRSGAAPIWDESVRLPFLFENEYLTTWPEAEWSYSDPFNSDVDGVETQLADDNALIQTYKALLNLRQTTPALRYGRVIPYEENTADLQGYYRVLDEGNSAQELVLVLHNLGSNTLSVEVEGQMLYYSGDDFDGTLSGFETVILRLSNLAIEALTGVDDEIVSTQLKTYYDTDFGEDVFFEYQLLHNNVVVQTWETLEGSYQHSDSEFVPNWVAELEHEAHLTVEWRAYVDKGTSITHMEGSNRVTPSGYAHFSTFNGERETFFAIPNADEKPDATMYPDTGTFSPVSEALWADAAYPLGSHFVDDYATFAVYSKHAEAILLEIYTDHIREDAAYAYWMEQGDDDIWRAKIDVTGEDVIFYGFRVWGPNWRLDSDWTRNNSDAGFIADYDHIYGHRFNPNKVLFDPYGLEISHDKENLYMDQDGENGGMFGTGGLDTGETHTYSGPYTTNFEVIDRRNVDTAHYAPKSVLVRHEDLPEVSTLTIPPEDLITMETHVRGFTIHESASNLEFILDGIPGFEDVVNIPEAYRGTYKGAAMMAPYLKALGYNAIEFLPVHETDNDANDGYLLDNKLNNEHPKPNYWGYMTLSFFAPDRRYSYDQSWGGPKREFMEMVQAFNDEGIAVFIDVVYNHTAEGGNWNDRNVTGFTSFGGFDTASYYTLSYDDVGFLEQGATGVGNQLNFGPGKEAARNIVKDSLIYWTEIMGVDGYRFDLAPVLGREPYSFNPEHDLLEWIAAYGQSQGVKMVAEPWDIWGLHLGDFPEGWGAWNNEFRDASRRFMRGDANTNDFVQALNGSFDVFGSRGMAPYYGINFLVAHDGVTLADLVSYNINSDADRDFYNNQDWPFGPSDGGTGNNTTWDSGGDQDLRRQRLRNFWVIQFFSRGIPMSVYGDEFGRTQNGNNNPYSLDSIATYNNYYMINTDSPHLVEIDEKYCHGIETNCAYHNNLGTDSNPDGINNIFLFARDVIHLRIEHETLRRTAYDTDYDFRKEDGISSLGESDRAIWLRINHDTDTDFLLFINMWTENIEFTVPEAREGYRWVRRIDTHHWAEANYNNHWAIEDAATIHGNYGVNPWSVVVLQEVPID